MEFTFEDMLFVDSSPSSSLGSNKSPELQTKPYTFASSPSDDEERVGRRETRSQYNDVHHRHTMYTYNTHGYYQSCPGAAHRGRAPCKFYVDPRTGAGKCHDPDCTWGFFNGTFIITDLKGYAYTSRGEPITFLLNDGYTRRHVRLAAPQRQ
ncbi:hypothetical protein FRC03_010508 [Tulasnella sp. 419]|nr:hypothetical protein FRC02_011702 [Tulasnella sp. 418]KAG8957139.1 hypothetical protein FRC03_010508 [Tulasnella sp. 419]